jgi:hypothetical protein
VRHEWDTPPSYHRGVPLKRRPKYTVSQAKNVLRRTVSEIMDRSPSAAQMRALWEHFEGRCAYCRKQLEADGRDWHLDHADSGGGNHAGNRVLACGICNGDEKREQGWREFLRVKASLADCEQQEALVREWLEEHARPHGEETAEVTKLLKELDLLIEQFANKCGELKALRTSVKQGR